ncbi:hypothetical protein AB4Y85_18655 [Microvirga sp. 2YAF29]
MREILDIIDAIGTIGQGVAALATVGLILAGRLTIRSFRKQSWWLWL